MKIIVAVAMLGLALPGAGVAQSSNPLGGLGGMLGGGVPSVASAGAGNAAGLLGYCVKNKVLGSANAGSVLGKLTGKPGIATSPGFAEGQQGMLQSGGKSLSLDGLRGQVKTQLCNQVLKHATSFL